MHSTKSIGLVIMFLLSTTLFHFLFKLKANSSGGGLWVASAAFGLILVYVLHLGTKKTHPTAD
jgi:accessory gene regulator protein AgrB